MKVIYDPETDALTIIFRDAKNLKVMRYGKG